MGDDSCSRGRGFESQHRKLDEHFFTLICCNICIVCMKRPQINEKEAGLAQFFKKNIDTDGIRYLGRGQARFLPI